MARETVLGSVLEIRIQVAIYAGDRNVFSYQGKCYFRMVETRFASNPQVYGRLTILSHASQVGIIFLMAGYAILRGSFEFGWLRLSYMAASTIYVACLPIRVKDTFLWS